MELEVAAVKYVGPATVKRLAEHGITTVEQLAEMSVEALTALPGIGENTAPLIIASAQETFARPPQGDAVAKVVLVDEVAPTEVTASNVLSIDEAAIEVVLVAALELGISDRILKKQAKKEGKARKSAKKAEKALKKATKKIAKKAEQEAKAEEKAVRKAEKKAAKHAKKDTKKAKKK